MRYSGRLLWLCQQPFFMHGCPHEKYVEPSALLLGCKTCQGPHFVDGLKKKVQPERARNAQLFCADCFLIVGTIEQQRYFCPFTLLWHFLSASSFFCHLLSSDKAEKCKFSLESNDPRRGWNSSDNICDQIRQSVSGLFEIASQKSRMEK